MANMYSKDNSSGPEDPDHRDHKGIPGRTVQGMQDLVKYIAVYVSYHHHTLIIVITGVVMEHLAGVVFGGDPLRSAPYTNDDYCRNFLRNCPGSPCH